MIEYKLDLMDSRGLTRIENILRKHYEIIEILDKDSKDSPEGGAKMYYKVKIKFEEKWS